MSMIPRHRIETQIYSLLSALVSSRTRNVDQFKAELERYFGKKIIFLQSGRAALYYLLRAMPQETIIIPAYTCKVVPEAVLLAGKRIIYVDIDIQTLNMDVNELKVKIQPGSIVLATHQFGIPCEIEKTIELAKENHCVVIEDCAAAFGSRVMGKLVGAFGLASIFSFEFTKVLSAGRGGFILFNDEDLFEKVRLLTNKELNKPSPLFMGKIMSMLFLHKVLTIPFVYSFFIRVFYEKYGFSMDKGEISPRMDELYRHALSPIEATIGLSNLKRVERIMRRRWEVAGQYLNSLAEIKGFGLPVLPPDSFCSWMRFPVRVLHQDKRDFYLACLKRGVDLGFTYAYSCSEKCKKSELAARQVVNLPMNSNLTGGEVIKIIKVVKDVIGAGG